jgi:nuclear cap-binding protein subunit 1
MADADFKEEREDRREDRRDDRRDRGNYRGNNKRRRDGKYISILFHAVARAA